MTRSLGYGYGVAHCDSRQVIVCSVYSQFDSDMAIRLIWQEGDLAGLYERFLMVAPDYAESEVIIRAGARAKG